MLEPTIENLYYLLKKVSVKPSLDHSRSLEINRADSLMGEASYSSNINAQKHFDVEESGSRVYVTLTKQVGNIPDPNRDKEIQLTIHKYWNENELIIIDGDRIIKC